MICFLSLSVCFKVTCFFCQIFRRHISATVTLYNVKEQKEEKQDDGYESDNDTVVADRTNKVCLSVSEALRGVKSGSTILFGGKL